jgi:hypothetical protein
VKCPRCLSVCLDDDPICFTCHRPFSGDVVPWSDVQGAYTSRLAIVFMIVGTCLGPVLGRAFLPGYSTELFDSWSLGFAAIGAGAGALLGYFLGTLVVGPDR